MTEQKTGNNQTFFYLGIFAVVIAILVALWLLLAKDEAPQPLTTPALTMPIAEPEPEVIAEPEPVTPPEPTAELQTEPMPDAEPQAVLEVPPPAPLPALDNSDADVKQRLLTLNWRPGLAGLFVTEEMLRNVVVQADNIAQGQLAANHPLLQPLPQRFSVPAGEPMQLTEAGFTRYQPYVQLLESVPPQQLIALFKHYEPLLQQAFADLGYPDELFEKRLLQAIDLLLATPEVQYPIELSRPSVMYQFADPALEQLPAPQKLMLRMGPDNQRRIKLLLQDYKKALQP